MGKWRPPRIRIGTTVYRHAPPEIGAAWFKAQLGVSASEASEIAAADWHLMEGVINDHRAGKLFVPQAEYYGIPGQRRQFLSWRVRPYALGERWITFVGKHPSTATDLTDDRTVTAVRMFALARGYSAPHHTPEPWAGVRIVNLTSIVADDTALLRGVSLENVRLPMDETWLGREVGDPSSLVIAGWGSPAKLDEYDLNHGFDVATYDWFIARFLSMIRKTRKPLYRVSTFTADGYARNGRNWHPGMPILPYNL